MDVSIVSILLFILVLALYFMLPIGHWGYQPYLLADVMSNNTIKLTEAYNRKNIGLGLLVAVVAFVQFILNTWHLSEKCGTGLNNNNLSTAALFTFVPWIMIFGIMVAILAIFPGFKSAFSDVIGYYVVAWSANNILAKLLTTDIKTHISEVAPEERTKMTEAAEAIMKMSGNNGILINTMNPENFPNIWNKLKILMPKDLIDGGTNYQQELFDLVLLKDNIGEMLWYLYTAILISSIVYYNLATRGCVKDVATIKKERDAYLKQQEEVDKQKQLNSTSYVG